MIKLTDTVRRILQAKKTGIVAASPDDTVLRALALMAEHDIGAVVVLDGERLVGIVSERDCARKVELLGRTASDLRLREIMSSELVAISPGDTIERGNILMVQHRIRHLPVVEGGRIVGVISSRDVLEGLVGEEEKQINRLETERLMIQTGSY